MKTTFQWLAEQLKSIWTHKPPCYLGYFWNLVQYEALHKSVQSMLSVSKEGYSYVTQWVITF